MKRPGLIICVTTLLAIAASPAAPAKGSRDKKIPAGPESAVYAKYDLDHNRKLNVEEGEAVRKDFAKNSNDPLLKPFDTDHDGVLSDAEIMAIPATTRAAATPKKTK